MQLYCRKSPLKLRTMLNFCGRNVMQVRYFVRLLPEHSSNLHFLYSIQLLIFLFDFLFLWVEGILKYWASRLTNYKEYCWTCTAFWGIAQILFVRCPPCLSQKIDGKEIEWLRKLLVTPLLGRHLRSKKKQKSRRNNWINISIWATAHLPHP